MKEYPLFTIGMVAYKNYRYIYDAIESVLMQDYPNIELIVSNDGSDDFNEDELIAYFNKNRTENISKIIINNNERNMGTCRHLNKVKSMSQGKYIMFLAADDALYDTKSISNIVQAFAENSEPYAVCGNCGMYDVELKDYSEIVPRKEVRDKLLALSPMELYREISTDMFIPTAATTYAAKAFEDFGDFDERVFLIEDWAFFLKMLRSGHKPCYVDVLVSKHRDGGICHGNESGVSEGAKLFHKDEMAIMEIELLPFEKELGKSLHKKLVRRYKYLKTTWFSKYEMQEATTGEKIRFYIKNGGPVLLTALSRIRHHFLNRILNSFADYRFVWKILVLCLLYYLDFSKVLGPKYARFASVLFGAAALIYGLAFIASVVIKELYRLYLPFKKLLKKLFRE